MNPPPADLLLRAFETTAGRDDGRDLPPGLMAFARQVVQAGRAVAAAPPCPVPALRRAEALFATPRGVGARLLALLLDSASGLTPALRGQGVRLLRYGGEGLSLDLELEPAADGRTRLRVALASGGSASGGAASGLGVALEVAGRSKRVALDAEGMGEAWLPRGRAAVRVKVTRGRAVLARTPDLPRG